MKRSLFLLITAILALLFGGLMFLAPSVAGGAFGIPASVATDALFRILGATLPFVHPFNRTGQLGGIIPVEILREMETEFVAKF